MARFIRRLDMQKCKIFSLQRIDCRRNLTLVVGIQIPGSPFHLNGGQPYALANSFDNIYRRNNGALKTKFFLERGQLLFSALSPEPDHICRILP